MNSEESRLRTFRGWPANAPVDSKRIAKAGFYFMGQGLEVQCFSCGSRICDWNYGDKVMARHKSLDPRCPFVLNPRQSGNVPLRTNLSSGGSTPVPLGTNLSAGGSTPSLGQPAHTTIADMTDASALRRSLVPNAYYDEAVRLASFEDWPQPSVVSPAKLAMAGFYYTNERCKVMCAYCDGIIVHWNPGDDPELIHQKCFPECQFINDRLKYRIHPYSNIMIRDKTNISESSEVEALKSLGVYYHRIPRNPKYSTIESRLRTYSEWSTSFNQLPVVLADAGFYYTGVGDKVRCFHCDGGLKEWKKMDDPWVEHARWFSDCTFLTMVKGPDFVKEALSTLPNVLEMELKNMQSQSQTQSQECHQVTEDYLMFLMSSSAAISALEMGIEASRVKSALKQKVKTTGSPYLEREADQLIIACMDIQSEEGSSAFDEGSSASPIFCRRVIRTREHIPESSEDSDEEEAAPAAVAPPDPVKKELEKPLLPLQSSATKKEPSEKRDTQVTLEEENRLLKEARLCKMTPSPNSLTEVLASTMTNKDGPTDSRINPNPVQLPSSSSLQNYIGNRRYYKESERLKTFERWPVSFLSPRTMTEAGFYFINRDDIVRCAFCNIEVGRWVEGDDPLADHERWAPACRFIRHIDVNNVPLGEEGSTSGDSGSESLEGFDVCGHGMDFQTESQRPASLLETHEGYLKSRAPCFANYATLDARLRSYDTWPISLKLKPNVLSDAGFFYTGKGDQTICYHCGGGLKDWEETDEPWVEHARWFSKCPYVLAVKGKSFIEEVNGSRAVQDVTQNGNIGLSCSTGDLDKVPSASVEDKVKKTTSEAVKTVGDQGSRPKEESQPPAQTHDGRLCKICFSEEMGAVFLPCGHIVACVKCAVSLTTCAICRQPVTGTFRAFLS